MSRSWGLTPLHRAEAEPPQHAVEHVGKSYPWKGSGASYGRLPPGRPIHPSNIPSPIQEEKVTSLLRRIVRRIAMVLGLGRPPRLHGEPGIRQLGHRQYVGGHWSEIGKLQFDFLVSQGLQPHHHLVDIACGSLRAGVHFIPYLDPGHYHGVDKEKELIRAGREVELAPGLEQEKAPDFLVSSSFEFEQLSARPDYAIAQSLFTHLPAPHVDLCFQKLRAVISDDGHFFATFFVTEEEVRNPRKANDHYAFRYTREQMLAFGERSGWTGTYIGNWGHRNAQMMVHFRPA